jgi:hypothetical protein
MNFCTPADGGVVEAALHDDADVGSFAVEEFVEPALLDELHRRRPALLPLVLLMHIGHRRHGNAAEVAPRILQRVSKCEVRALVAARGEMSIDVTGANAQLQHHRRVGGFRQLEAGLDRAHDRGQVRARIEQPHLRFHGEGVDALLHDGGTLAVILADDDQRAAGDAAGGEVGERVGGDIGADGGLERHRAAQRIVHRGGEGRGRRGLARAVLEMDAELAEDVTSVRHHVHQVRDRRALVASDIGDARLQQRLGHRQDALAMKLGAFAELQLLDFLLERTFRHRMLSTAGN